ncbi:MAG: LysR family transcriptional regulator [Rhizobiales bacterium]|nr:LysR family transcriptional regulator [Hyphomicrobiales bacterium]
MDVSAGLDLTQSFLVLAEELNFRRTAQRLAIDQSALTRRIQKLEMLLGFALFERTTREVSLTPAGRAFYEANAGLLHGFTASVRAARRVAEGKTGTLRVGYMAFAALGIMPPAVTHFRQAAPDVDVRLSYMRTQGQKLALSDGSLDVGYMIGPFEHSEFHSLTMATDPLAAVTPADHPLAAGRTVRPADLDGVPLVLGDMAEWEAYRWRLDEMFASAGFRPTVVMEASSTLALIGLVQAGLGISIYPARIARLLGDDLAVRPIDDPRFRMETILVWKRTNRTASVRRYVDIARRLAAGSHASPATVRPQESR